MKYLVCLGVAIWIAASADIARAEEAENPEVPVEAVEDPGVGAGVEGETTSEEQGVEPSEPAEALSEETPPATDDVVEPESEPEEPAAAVEPGCDEDAQDQHRSYLVGGLVLTPIGIVDLAIGTAMLAVTATNGEGGLGDGFLGTASIITMVFGAAFTTIGAILWGLGRARRNRCRQSAAAMPHFAVGYGSERSTWAFAVSWRI